MLLVLLAIVCSLLMLVGLAGIVLPFFPGVPLVWLGLFIFAIGTGFGHYCTHGGCQEISSQQMGHNRGFIRSLGGYLYFWILGGNLRAICRGSCGRIDIQERMGTCSQIGLWHCYRLCCGHSIENSHSSDYDWLLRSLVVLNRGWGHGCTIQA